MKQKRSVRREIPVSNFIQEALDLFEWCGKDKEILIHAGLDWKFAEEIPDRAQALITLEASWIPKFRGTNEMTESWKELYPNARTLQKSLLRHFRYAFYSMPDVLNQLKSISRIHTIAGLIQSLFDLAEIGGKHSTELQKIHFDFQLLETARETGNTLVPLHARVNSLKKEKNIALELRNKAYSDLKEAVDEVKRAGKFALRNNKNRLRGYSSDFFRMKKQKQKRVKMKS